MVVRQDLGWMHGRGQQRRAGRWRRRWVPGTWRNLMRPVCIAFETGSGSQRLLPAAQTSQMLLLPPPEPASGQEPPFRRDLEGWGADVNIPVAVPPSVRSLSQMHNSRAADAAVGTIGRT